MSWNRLRFRFGPKVEKNRTKLDLQTLVLAESLMALAWCMLMATQSETMHYEECLRGNFIFPPILILFMSGRQHQLQQMKKEHTTVISNLANLINYMPSFLEGSL